MRFGNRFSLLLSLQDAGAIDTTGGGAAPPAAPVSEPVAVAPEPVAAPDPFVAMQAALEKQYGDEAAPVEAPITAAPPAVAVEGAAPDGQAAAEAVAAAPEIPAAAELSARSRYAALLDLPPGDEGYKTAGELLSEFKTYDNPGYYTIAETIYEQERPQITRMVLEDLGREAGVASDVVKARVQQVMDYIKTGTGLPVPVQSPEFPSLDMVDQYGYLRLPSGREIRLKNDEGTEIPEGMETYENSKRLFELDQREAQRTAQDNETARVAEQERAVNLRNMERYATGAVFEDFHEASLAALDTVLSPTLATLATDEDKLAGKMMTAYIHEHLDAHPEAQKLAERISSYLEQLIPQVVRQCAAQRMPVDQIKAECAKVMGRGRVADLIKQYNDLSRREAETVKSQFITSILRRNKAELAATRTDPVFPEGTRTITATTPLAPSNQPPRTVDEALEKVRGIVGSVL